MRQHLISRGRDYSEGSGREDFNWDVVFHGPVIGMSKTW
jgi:hypothetical protein